VLAASSTKGATGHMLGAAGADRNGHLLPRRVGSRRSLRPPLNLDNPDPELRPQLRAHTPAGTEDRRSSPTTPSASAGHNAILIGKRFQG
jgi:3-oxoacyl-(acyl-carrier-protein) synthase